MKKNICIFNKKGFSLLEMVISLIVLAIILSTMTPTAKSLYNRKFADKIQMDMTNIVDAARRYYVVNNSWPASVAALQTSSTYLPSGWSNTNHVGNAYTVSSNASTFTVSSNTGSVDIAKRIQNALPITTRTTSTVTTSTPVPGTNSLNSYDSGWFSVSRLNNYTKTHNLNTTNVMANIWFSDTSDGSGLVYGPIPFSWRDHNPEKNNGIAVIDMTTTNVTIHFSDHIRVPSSSAGADNAIGKNGGYVRITMLALD